ncbi:MAG: polyprenyl synthetase family protein [Thermoanaerobaculales bacterium]|jgi:geranylgeranyl diphosphate synthase type II|nr:polyprenyl synthetase family protein [Thermoanaerobaculales bacterium]
MSISIDGVGGDGRLRVSPRDDAGREASRHWRRRIDARLAELVPPEDQAPSPLHQAMRYSLLAGGKRIRPVLAIQVATDLGASIEDVLDVACAVEMVHTASLILDDLPCMDDASLRRGRPANHLVFGEDTAILAATALLNRAFGVIAECDRLPAQTRIDLSRLLSESVGSHGIIAGQFCDLRIRHGHGDDVAGLTEMYGQKTGALFVAALEAGARVAQVEEPWVRAVREYAVNLGLAFQLLDDLLDTFGSSGDVGKDTRQDDGKSTLASRLGAHGARQEVHRYVESAASALEPLGSSGLQLANLARDYTHATMERVAAI